MNNPALFRGKTLDYWIKIIFSDLIEFFNKENSDSRIVFNISKLLKIAPGGIFEITRLFEPDEKALSTLKDFPFYIVPKKIFEDYSASLFSSKQFELIEPKDYEIIDLQTPYQVYSEKDDPLEIEKTIVEFQIRKLKEAEVYIEDYFNFYIEGLPQIAKNTTISSGVVIKGDCSIGENVTLYPNTYIENSKIGDGCEILPGSLIRDSILRGGNKIGPYSHLRFGTEVEKDANIGNFVEMKKTLFGNGSKAMHLSYIGDATVGKDVNIGAGTITCNYDGKKKHPTVIEDNSFIGSGTELVAPVTVRKNSYVAAGSTINEDVPEDSLAIARQKQRIIKDWAKRKKK